MELNSPEQNNSEINGSSCLQNIRQGMSSARTDEERIKLANSLYLLCFNSEENAEQITKSEKYSFSLIKKADSHYKQKDYIKAHRKYTQSISAAPQGSESLALAFANRSAVLSSMGKNAECLADIGCALSHGYPPELRHKLWLRAAQSHRELGQTERAAENFFQAELSLEESVLSEEQKSAVWDKIKREISEVQTKKEVQQLDKKGEVPRLSYGENCEAPVASSAVTIECNEVFGRHLVASRDIKPGDVLLVEHPFAAVLEAECRWSHCSHCLTRSLALLPCPACDWALYCSEECLEEAASRYHRVECPVVTRYRSQNDHVGSNELHTIRVISTCGVPNLAAYLEEDKSKEDSSERTRGFNSEGQFISSDFNSVLSLSSHIISRPFEEIFSACFIALNILHSFQLANLPQANKLAGLFFRIFFCRDSNAHSLVELFRNDDSSCSAKKIGCGIFPTSSFVNHSCTPNIFRTNYGQTLVHRASRSIAKGSQLMISYGVQFDKTTKKERQMYLSKYFFTCSCAACINDWPLKASLPEMPEFFDEKTERKARELISAKTDDHGGLQSSDLLNLNEELVVLLSAGDAGSCLNQLFLSAEWQIKNYYRMLAQI